MNAASPWAVSGRHDDTRRHARGALELFGRLDDPRGQGNAHLTMAEVLAAEDRYEAALDDLNDALRLFEDAGLPRRSRTCSTPSAGVTPTSAITRRRWSTAARPSPLHREIEDSRGEAAAWDSLGYAYHHLGDHGRATACYERAIGLYRHAADWVGEATALVALGDAHDVAADPAAALDAWRRALDILGQLHHPKADQVRSKISRLGQAAPRF